MARSSYKSCKNAPDKLCYMYVSSWNHKVDRLQELWRKLIAYFGCQVGSWDKSWVSHAVYVVYDRKL